ncbi:malonate decarboxylase epsilon subunit [Virgibacillus natechei]|uniref:Malonyl CoA-acyl carrier protein transacylase n=1 Tax=Virgibacillus natechei TaxID=1216297 RepID=A0ABS4IHV5_9BACI|nr:malonate decarboxylase subunit epsilon [Virgibacillus natechei]MBP1970031.1 malonate decarboxylase epsilon subunit [Virgibacillus natechei]UZD14117.1 malonate decarboxylase subunit epsilon [Virgibacillus natechei]
MVTFLFPGQGSQFPNMLHSLPNHTKIYEVIERAGACLDENPYDWCVPSALISTRNIQLSMLTMGVSCARALMAEGVTPKFVAGHSVGAYAAAVISNVLSFEDALQVVKYRGEEMEAAFPVGYGMGVIQGLPFNVVDILLKECRDKGHTVYIANENSASQIAISGYRDSIEYAFKIASKKGARGVQWLDVSIPSHCPLFSELGKSLDQKLDTLDIASPEVPYIANRTARMLSDPVSIQRDLAFNIEAPVRWHDGMTMLYERGVRQFVQLPPGDVYTDLINQNFEEARALSVVNNVESLTNFLRRDR